MTKRKTTKGQTTIYKTLHRKLKIETKTRTPIKTGVNSGAPDDSGSACTVIISFCPSYLAYVIYWTLTINQWNSTGAT